MYSLFAPALPLGRSSLFALAIGFVATCCVFAQPPIIIGQVDDTGEEGFVTTAKEYLKRYNDNPQAMIRAKLSPEEAKIVAEALRKKFPFESLTERLAYEKEQFGEPAKKTPNEQPDVRSILGFYGARGEGLRRIHSGEVAEFINRNGFGISRMPEPSPSMFHLPDPKPLPLATISVSDDIHQEAPVSLPADEKAKSNIGRRIAMPSTERLKNYAQQTAWHFSSPWFWGYVKDREHVAGFKSHAMQYVYPLVEAERAPEQPTQGAEPSPESAKQDPNWKTANLELVSLLKHDEPAAYVSDNLPLMSELVKARVRPLNKFEADAIASLKRGEEIVHRATTNRIEMVGAIRAQKSCTDCHYAPEGALLGAFTYEFIRVPTIEPAKPQPAS